MHGQDVQVSIFWSLDSIAWTGRASVYILEFEFNSKSLCRKMYGQDVQVSIFWSLVSTAWTGRAGVYILEFGFNCKSLMCYKMYGQDVQVSIFWSLDSSAKVCAIKCLDGTCKCLYFGVWIQ